MNSYKLFVYHITSLGLVRLLEYFMISEDFDISEEYVMFNSVFCCVFVLKLMYLYRMYRYFFLK